MNEVVYLLNRMSKKILQFVLKPFVLPVRQPFTNRMVAAVRVVFGLLLLHRYFNMAMFSILNPNPSVFEVQTGIAVLLSAMITVGFFTPVALAGVFAIFVAPILGIYLGTQIGVIVIWGLLFLGAGKHYSVDALLIPRAPNLYRLVYITSVNLNARTYGLIRFVLLLMFYGVNIAAISSHFQDNAWTKNQTLQFALVTPVVTPFYQTFIRFRDSFPQLFEVTLTVSLFFQSIWELFTLPLMYFQIGRWYVALYGLAFFVIAWEILQLGYLPPIELCWWVLVFGAPDFWQFRSKNSALELPHNAVKDISFNRRFLMVFTLIVCFVVTEFSIASAKSYFEWQNRPDPRAPTNPYRSLDLSLLGNRQLYYAFGQGPVVIFSSPELKLLTTYYVLYETTSDGLPKRIVPVVDSNGARLNYYHNDYFLFDLVTAKYVFSKPPTWDEYTLASMHRIINLDVCLNEGTGENQKYYGATMFTRRLMESGSSLWWGDPEPLSSVNVTLDTERMKSIQEKCPLLWGILPRTPIHLGIRSDGNWAEETLALIIRLRAVK